jgi:hypothetical protein
MFGMLRVSKPPKVVEELRPLVFLLVYAHNMPNAKALER